MKFLYIARLAILVTLAWSLSGCFLIIPSVIKMVNEDKLKTESEGAILESNTGILKLNTQTNATDIKLNAYIQGYNDLTHGPWSLWPSYNTFMNQTLNSKPRQAISFPVIEGLKKGITSFKKGLALNGQNRPELDKVIIETKSASERLLKDERSILPYFRNEEYRQDNLAQGKIMFPILKADYDTLIACTNRLGDLLIKLQKTRTEKNMAMFKSQKNMIRFHTEQSLNYAQDLITSFNNPKQGITKNRHYIQGDLLVSKLENALNAMLKSMDDTYPSRTTKSDLDDLHRSLTGMVQSYRILKEKKTDRSFNIMMKRYNDAIDSYNRFIKSSHPI